MQGHRRVGDTPLHCRARTVMWHGNFNDRSNSSGLPSASVSAAIVHVTFFLPADFELFDALDTLAAVGDICRSSGRSRRAVVSGLKQPLRGAHFLPPHYGLPMFTKQCASYNPSAYTRSLQPACNQQHVRVCTSVCPWKQWHEGQRWAWATVTRHCCVPFASRQILL